jgi:hypothetical protein
MKQEQKPETKQEEKQELGLEDLTGVAGGAQVEVNNKVKDNKHDVNIGPTVVINM